MILEYLYDYREFIYVEYWGGYIYDSRVVREYDEFLGEYSKSWNMAFSNVPNLISFGLIETECMSFQFNLDSFLHKSTLVSIKERIR